MEALLEYGSHFLQVAQTCAYTSPSHFALGCFGCTTVRKKKLYEIWCAASLERTTSSHDVGHELGLSGLRSLNLLNSSCRKHASKVL